MWSRSRCRWETAEVGDGHGHVVFILATHLEENQDWSFIYLQDTVTVTVTGYLLKIHHDHNCDCDIENMPGTEIVAVPQNILVTENIAGPENISPGKSIPAMSKPAPIVRKIYIP